MAVLGRETLKHIRTDAKTTTVPSWMGSPPSHAGSKRAGKLSADEWRAFLIYCMITLIPLWCEKGGRYLLMLENFMDLVMAIKLGTSRSISLGQPEAYTFYMRRYLSNLFKLFPETSFKPNHHASLHDGTFLRGLGPVHSWSTWVFERLNALMQSFSTNSIPGQFTSFIIHILSSLFCVPNRGNGKHYDECFRPNGKPAGHVPGEWPCPIGQYARTFSRSIRLEQPRVLIS